MIFEIDILQNSENGPKNAAKNRPKTKMSIAVQFHFAALRIESHQNCSFDYVEVWDGTRRASTNYLLARFCNSTTPAPVTSSGHISTVVFHSDDSVSDLGFHITWAAAPGE